MHRSSAPLEGVVVIVVDAPDATTRIEKALAQAGATVFVAHDRGEIRRVLTTITPHFAVIDPTSADGTGPTSAAWMFFSHPECRTIVYSSNLRTPPNATPGWLVDKSRPVSDVTEAILAAVNDRSLISKGGEDLKPVA